MKNDDEKKFIILLRFIAIIFVVLVHVVAIPIQTWDLQYNWSYILYILLYSLGCCGVPIFLMISGALLLEPKKLYSVEDVYKKKIPRILICLLIYGFIYACLEIYFVQREITANIFLDAILMVINGESWDHLWYLYMLLGIYILLPILKYLVVNVPDNMYIYITIVFLSLGYVVPTINSIFGINISVNAPLPLCHITSFWMGHTIVKYKDSNIFNKSINIIGMVSLFVVISSCILSVIFKPNVYTCIASYNSFFILGTTVLVFRICMRHVDKLNRFVKSIADCSFGIYLIHPFFMNVFYKVIEIQPHQFNGFISVPFFVILLLLPSWIIVMILKKVPLLKKLV